MLGNDISNVGLPAIVVIFDDLIGVRAAGPPPGYQPPGTTLLDKIANRLHRTPPPPAFHWEVDRLVAAALQRLFDTGSVNIDVVEFCDQVATITTLLDEAYVPYRSLQHTRPDHLARDLALRPDIAAVYHPYPEHGLKYGSRGRLVTPHLRTMIGMF